ncbi:DUF2255 family protein [Streptomyces iconiensis]|uniref:DUF2255 family protein n=1 Tax=Streptomyces iconiensis TaxID=1384038 RepID=A0ABT7A2X7_9ACTN|nr:DUF2255 family protein [Streptomyces iconiensis]MDJ1135675.1 DUF2255 family protein [Streptomyces iconiensis]
MPTWSNDELNRVAGTEEMQVAPLRQDGSLSSWRTIWVVRDGDGLYVRSVNGPTSQWYRGTRDRHEGRIRADGMEKDVTFVDADTDAHPTLNEQVDAAYRTKYADYAAPLEAINGPQARTTTMRLVPHA